MNARMLLTHAAFLARQEADELLVASHASRSNAEALEEVVCNGTDEEVNQALRLVMNPSSTDRA